MNNEQPEQSSRFSFFTWFFLEKGHLGRPVTNCGLLVLVLSLLVIFAGATITDKYDPNNVIELVGGSIFICMLLSLVCFENMTNKLDIDEKEYEAEPTERTGLLNNQ